MKKPSSSTYIEERKLYREKEWDNFFKNIQVTFNLRDLEYSRPFSKISSGKFSILVTIKVERDTKNYSKFPSLGCHLQRCCKKDSESAASELVIWDSVSSYQPSY